MSHTTTEQGKRKRGPRNYVSSVKPATLSLAGLIQYVDRSKSWLYMAMDKFAFPRPIKVGGKNSNLWFRDEVDRWLDGQRVKRDLPTSEGVDQ